MLIQKRSPRTGEYNTRDIPVTHQQFDAWKRGDGLIQNIMPDLSADDREFLMTGYTPEDWAAIFPPEEEEEITPPSAEDHLMFQGKYGAFRGEDQ